MSERPAQEVAKDLLELCSDMAATIAWHRQHFGDYDVEQTGRVPYVIDYQLNRRDVGEEPRLLSEAAEKIKALAAEMNDREPVVSPQGLPCDVYIVPGEGPNPYDKPCILVTVAAGFLGDRADECQSAVLERVRAALSTVQPEDVLANNRDAAMTAPILGGDHEPEPSSIPAQRPSLPAEASTSGETFQSQDASEQNGGCIACAQANHDAATTTCGCWCHCRQCDRCKGLITAKDADDVIRDGRAAIEVRFTEPDGTTGSFTQFFPNRNDAAAVHDRMLDLLPCDECGQRPCACPNV